MRTFLLLLVACSAPPSPPGETGGGAETGETADTGEPTDPCDGLTCVSACGVPIAVMEPAVSWGFEVESLPEAQVRQVGWHDGTALSVEGRSLVRYDAALSELGRAEVLPFPIELAIAGDVAVLAAADGGWSVLDLLEAAPSPTAWWAPMEDLDGEARWAQLVGASAGRVVLLSTGGLSLLDATDPSAPVELACVPLGSPEETWTAKSNDRWAVVGSDLGALLVNLNVDPPVLVDSLPLDQEGAVALDGDRLAVWEELRTVVLYDLSAGAPAELGRRADDTRVQVTDWNPRVAGGLVLQGGLDDERRWALDLASDDLALYSTDTVDPELACAASYADVDGEPALDLAPIWFPEERFEAGALADLSCPGGETSGNAISGGSREPEGDRVLLLDGRWWVVDLATGEAVDVGEHTATQGFWLDGGLAFAYTDGLDWDVPMVSTLTRTDEEGAEIDVVESPGPFVAFAQVHDQVWALSEPTGRDYGDDEPPATERLLWRVDGFTDLESVTLPAGAAPVDVVGGGGLAWVFDEAGQVHVFDTDGAWIDSLTLPTGLGDGTRAASALGAFYLDARGHPCRITAEGVATELSDEALAGQLVGADDTYVYAALTVRPGPLFVAWQGLFAFDPDTPEVHGALPTWRDAEVLGGEPLAVFDQDLVVLHRPE